MPDWVSQGYRLKGGIMSAWNIGTERITSVQAYGVQDQSAFKTYVDRIQKWIPGDILALYVAGVTLLASGEDGGPNPVFLVVMALVTPVVVVLGEVATRRDLGSQAYAKAGLAIVAFIVWSLTVPESGWQEWDVIASNAGLVTIVSAICGLLFGLVADVVALRFFEDKPEPHVQQVQVDEKDEPGV